MTITAYLFRYTLDNVCHGNLKDFACRLGCTESELEKVLNSQTLDDDCPLLDELLLMHHRENRSIDSIIQFWKGPTT